MHVDLYVALAGLIVGFTVGLTGMGGGALMTPILVLLFKVQPLAAVSSDLVAAVVMKPVGGGVHLRRGTVNFALVRWLMLGSVPAAFAGVLVLRQLGDGAVVQERVKLALGWALLLAAGSIAARALLRWRATRRAARAAPAEPVARRPFRLRPLPTVLIGVVGGLVVGMTSVGSGSLMIVLLLLVYPMLSSRELVGTDLVQAIPLVGSAALGHLLFGDFKLALTASLLLGSLPGVYLGARVSSRAREVVIRPALTLLFLASGLKLLNLPTDRLAVVLAAVVLLALPVWGVLDAAAHSTAAWKAIDANRRAVLAVLGAGAPLGVGFVAALVYFSRIRPRLVAAVPNG
ncbi:MAG TPA: sulfite exporter TauE/SafE family protein [Actinomycetes bacterium]